MPYYFINSALLLICKERYSPCIFVQILKSGFWIWNLTSKFRSWHFCFCCVLTERLHDWWDTWEKLVEQLLLTNAIAWHVSYSEHSSDMLSNTALHQLLKIMSNIKYGYQSTNIFDFSYRCQQNIQWVFSIKSLQCDFSGTPLPPSYILSEQSL